MLRLMKWNDLKDETCPVARGLSVIGDRWTMLVLRDCFRGVRRFDEIQGNLGVTRHVLINRLRKLEAAGVLRREQYHTRPPRFEYRLTEAGKALAPVMITLVDWANAHVPVDGGAVLLDRETGAPLRPRLVNEATGAPISHRNVTIAAQD
jgi:DNA-binding HxlR family transcriptional regulator